MTTGETLRRKLANSAIVLRMLIYHKGGVRLGYVLHDGSHCGQRVDAVHFVHRSSPVPRGRTAPGSTVILMLDQAEEALRSGLSETTAYEIRRSERDRTSCGFLEPLGAAELQSFLKFYDEFVKLTGYSRPSFKWLETLRGANSLAISVVRDPDGEELVYHAYIVDGKSCRLLHSASLQKRAGDREERNLLSRANRLLHWRDILHFKSSGVEIYDFGGWYPRKDDQQMLGVNRFKESFGGKVVFGAHCDLALTLKGRAWLWLKRMGWLKGAAGVVRALRR